MTGTMKETFTPSAAELAAFHERGYLGPFKVYEQDEMRKLWPV